MEADNRILDLVRALEKQGPVVWLDGSGGHGSGRSWVAGEPKEILEVVPSPDGTHWNALENAVLKGGWWFGVIPYEAGVPPHCLRSSMPLWLMRPGFLLELDHQSGSERLHIGTWPETSGIEGGAYFMSQPQPGIPFDRFSGAVRQIRSDIHEGSYYELNLTFPVTCRLEGDVLAAYDAGRRIAQAPFSMYLHAYGPRHLLCFSPERFLRKSGSHLVSEPIKGTRANGRDSKPAGDLSSSAKDRAEHLMIVDLVRHDLATVCRPGSVRVDPLMEIRSFPTVHQMVSAIHGELSPGVGAVEAFRACFPMGSMTGAPKRRVMEAIHQLETGPRGWYSGAAGYFSPAGDFDFNVVIRSLSVEHHSVVYGVGGAITADSEEVAEWEETRVKQKVLDRLFETASGRLR